MARVAEALVSTVLLLAPRLCSCQFLHGLDSGKLAGALHDVGVDKVVDSAAEVFKDPHAREVAEEARKATEAAGSLAGHSEVRRALEALKNTDPGKVEEILGKADPAKINKALDALETLDNLQRLWPLATAAVVAIVLMLVLARCHLTRRAKRWNQAHRPALLGPDPELELAEPERLPQVSCDESPHFQAF